ncbi:MAG: hypothetical protein ABW155_20145 [Candidatus Thiodiazotropha sp.]
MAARRNRGPKQHKFRNKLLLNQWLASLFGIDPLREHPPPPEPRRAGKQSGRFVRPFHILAEPIRDPRLEGFTPDNLHNFYHALVGSNLFWNDACHLSREQLFVYEENIARHAQTINEGRERPVVWKYFQWLTLVFAEVYLDRYFGRPCQHADEFRLSGIEA